MTVQEAKGGKRKAQGPARAADKPPQSFLKAVIFWLCPLGSQQFVGRVATENFWPGLAAQKANPLTDQE
jgi:hypothetical protein